ncbi:Sjogren's syndrome/scleroderma autoantigen 1 family protein [Haladaptatus caseinilyticus]|uniref:Sjogren's syndrome/scleroderma autoantigen 1 family protein n=1 Tax=Haladaptatus caseinilyticus TaxID=2993314 RepID=UPI00224B8FCB|nr:Sjogren's syndrome/scleroderma autoantigen 1 family protein [Haladaptatus caseinilyticus]
MSDFDKEAEREKLRQQYEADKEERKATQRMSELLLQGATMTGKHCDTCGDPIFRQNGTEFCPTCQQQQPAAESPTENASNEGTREGTNQANEETATEASTAENSTNIEVEESGAATADQPGKSEQSPGPSHHHPRSPPKQSGAPYGHSSESGTGVEQGGGAGDLTDARNALVRKLTRLATEAERTDDVGRARELLVATREAAEAVTAIDRAKQ